MTNEQKQCLLRYLGYYTGDVDGIWGSDSKAATKDFQKANGLDQDGVFGNATKKKILAHIANETGFKKVQTTNVSKTGDWWDDIEYFEKSEFACHCGGKYCKGYPAEPQEKLIRVADAVRKALKAPATVSSGVRCEKHNANVGGVSNSKHLSGKAMDFCIKGKTANQVLAEVRKHKEITYAYAIDNNYVHMNI